MRQQGGSGSGDGGNFKGPEKYTWCKDEGVLRFILVFRANTRYMYILTATYPSLN